MKMALVLMPLSPPPPAHPASPAGILSTAHPQPYYAPQADQWDQQSSWDPVGRQLAPQQDGGGLGQPHLQQGLPGVLGATSGIAPQGQGGNARAAGGVQQGAGMQMMMIALPAGMPPPRGAIPAGTIHGAAAPAGDHTVDVLSGTAAPPLLPHSGYSPELADGRGVSGGFLPPLGEPQMPPPQRPAPSPRERTAPREKGSSRYQIIDPRTGKEVKGGGGRRFRITNPRTGEEVVGG